MPQPNPPTTTAQERKIRSAILRVVSERGLGRRPFVEITTGDVAAMAHAAWRTLPSSRTVERAANGKLPADLRERAAVLAPSREAAAKAAVCPPVAPKAPPGSTEPLGRSSARESALRRLQADPTACAVLKLLSEGGTDPAIAQQLGLVTTRAKNLVRRWLAATESPRRTDLAAWAKRHAAAVEPQAGR